MLIPIENIYYLLCYAWNKLQERDQVRIEVDDRTELLDLFARILINGTKILLKRGIERNYIAETLEYAGVKGKLELSPTLKAGIHLQQRTICTMDEFSANIITNRILVTTLLRLLQTKGLDKTHHAEIKSLIWRLSGIDPIALSHNVFSRVRLHRNNHFYGFLLNVCRMLYDNSLPSEKPGEFLFKDFTRDEKQMSSLFEAFLLNFYRIEFPEWTVKSEHLTWQFSATDQSHLDYLPKMITDISITTPSGRIIVDAKYYRHALTQNFDKEKVMSQNLYQIFSYLMNQRSDKPETWRTRGILLYPSTGRELDILFLYENHPIQIKTVNLNMNWRKIEERLKDIVVFGTS